MGKTPLSVVGLVCLIAGSCAFGADLLLDDFNGSYPGGVEEDWERAWWNGTWLATGLDYTSSPRAQAFKIAVGDTCVTGCESAIQRGHGEGATIRLSDVASDIDPTKPWLLICNVSGHNDGTKPDHFLGYWFAEFGIYDFSGGTSNQYRKVYWTSANDKVWDQILFKTAGSTSGDNEFRLFMWTRWGPYAIPTVQDSYVVFDDFRLTYTPNHGDVTPPGQVIGLAAARGDGNITLTWQNPSDTDFAGTLIRMRTDHAPVTKWDGQLVANLPGLPGAMESFLHAPADNETGYYYAAYTYDNRNVPAPNYANYSEAVIAEAPGPVVPSYDANIAKILALGWDVVNHGNAADLTFNDSSPPTSWNTTTPTPSGDNRSAQINTVGSTSSLKWREESDLSSQAGTSMFMVWRPQPGLRCSPAGVWGSSAHTVLELRSASVKLKINADSLYSMYSDSRTRRPDRNRLA